MPLFWKFYEVEFVGIPNCSPGRIICGFKGGNKESKNKEKNWNSFWIPHGFISLGWMEEKQQIFMQIYFGN